MLNAVCVVPLQYVLVNPRWLAQIFKTVISFKHQKEGQVAYKVGLHVFPLSGAASLFIK